MRSAPFAWIAVVVLAGCGRPPVALDSASTETSATSTESTEATTSPGTTTETETETDEGEEMATFVPDNDIASFPKRCSMYYPTDICLAGEKCVPGDLQGESSRKCVPVVGDGQVGDPCEVDEDDVDTCGETSWCFLGTCQAYCKDANDPTCDDPDKSCMTATDNEIACMLTCDPLAPECATGETCMYSGTPHYNAFTCVLSDEPPKQLGEVCEYINSCAAGLYCVSEEYLPDCPDSGCCAAFCDVEDPDVMCEAAGTSCEPFWQEEPQEPWLNLGLCMVPI